MSSYDKTGHEGDDSGRPGRSAPTKNQPKRSASVRSVQPGPPKGKSAGAKKAPGQKPEESVGLSQSQLDAIPQSQKEAIQKRAEGRNKVPAKFRESIKRFFFSPTGALKIVRLGLLLGSLTCFIIAEGQESYIAITVLEIFIVILFILIYMLTLHHLLTYIHWPLLCQGFSEKAAEHQEADKHSAGQLPPGTGGKAPLAVEFYPGRGSPGETDTSGHGKGQEGKDIINSFITTVFLLVVAILTIKEKDRRHLFYVAGALCLAAAIVCLVDAALVTKLVRQAMKRALGMEGGPTAPPAGDESTQPPKPKAKKPKPEPEKPKTEAEKPKPEPEKPKPEPEKPKPEPEKPKPELEKVLSHERLEAATAGPSLPEAAAAPPP